MTWISKHLTLDLLAITIDGLNKVFDRISAEEDQSPWPTAPTAPHHEAPTPAVEPATPQTTVVDQPAPVAENPATPEVPTDQLITEAQTVLRTIAQTEGNDWILNTLFPHFGVQSLVDIPMEHLPEVIAMATQRQGPTTEAKKQ